MNCASCELRTVNVISHPYYLDENVDDGEVALGIIVNLCFHCQGQRLVLQSFSETTQIYTNIHKYTNINTQIQK